MNQEGRVRFSEGQGQDTEHRDRPEEDLTKARCPEDGRQAAERQDHREQEQDDPPEHAAGGLPDPADGSFEVTSPIAGIFTVDACEGRERR